MHGVVRFVSSCAIVLVHVCSRARLNNSAPSGRVAAPSDGACILSTFCQTVCLVCFLDAEGVG